jgi:hypothetical protein
MGGYRSCCRGEQQMEKKSSPSDWVQVIILFLSLCLGTWELVIRDRDNDRLKSQVMLDLWARQNSEFLVKSDVEAAKVYNKTLGRSPNYNEATDIFNNSLPRMQQMAAWDLCIQAKICNEETTKTLVCTNLRNFRDTLAPSLNALNITDDKLNPNYLSMVKRCG